MRARAISDSQAGAKVVRIGHAIEQQQKRRTLYAIDQLGEITCQREFACPRDHPLMPASADHGIQPLIVGMNDAHIGGLGRAQQPVGEFFGRHRNLTVVVSAVLFGRQVRLQEAGGLRRRNAVDPVGLERARNQILVRSLCAREVPAQRLELAALDLYALGRDRRLGIAGGVALALNIDVVVPFIQNLFGVQFLSKEVYYISDLPSDLQWGDVWGVTLIAFVLALLATIYPSWRASRVNPAEALRYE